MSESQLPCTDRMKRGYIKRDGKYYKHVEKKEACKAPTVAEMRAALKKAGCAGYSKMKRAQIIKEYLKRQECKTSTPRASKAKAPKPLPKRPPPAVQRLIRESLKDASKMASSYRSPQRIVAPPNSLASTQPLSDYEQQPTPIPKKKLHISLSPDDDTPQTMKKKLHLSLSPDDDTSSLASPASKKASASKKSSASAKSPSPARPTFVARGLAAPRKQQQGFWSWVGWN